MNKREILIRVLRGSANRKERKQIEQWLSSQNEIPSLAEGISQEVDIRPTSADLTEIRRILQASRRRRQRIAVLLVLIVIILIVSIITILLNRPPEPKNLIFHNTEISTVMAQLQSSFDVTIQYQRDQTQDCRFTGEFYRAASIDEALDVLSEATGMQWNKISKEVYTINGNCNKMN